MSYHNTNALKGESLKNADEKAASQEEVIMTWMRFLGQATPSMVLKACGHNWPIQSVRRAMSNLTKRGELTKTAKTAIGEWGAPEHFWSLPIKGQHHGAR